MLACQEPGVLIPLTRGFVAIVDADDVPLVIDRSWQYFINQQGREYAMSRHGRRHPTLPGRPIYMHRIIMGVEGRLPQIDHVSGNGLDNRRQNLRLCTSQQNHFNQRKTRGTSQFKGVYRRTDCNRWHASIRIHGRNINLGLFESEHRAAAAYDLAAIALFKDFARPNFTDEARGALDGDGVVASRVKVILETPDRAKRQLILGKTSRFRGVSKANKSKWVAYINSGGKQRVIGRFTNEEEAARAYDAAACELFGEFARLNFPESATLVV